MANKYEKLRRKAIKYGWTTPVNDVWSDDVWMRYWQASEDSRKDPSLGRPIAPHRSGGGLRLS